MSNSIRWSLIEGHGPPRVGSGKWKGRRRQGLGGRGNFEATPETHPLSSEFGYSFGGTTRVLGRGSTVVGTTDPGNLTFWAPLIFRHLTPDSDVLIGRVHGCVLIAKPL
jgi:hypothetical protein